MSKHQKMLLFDIDGTLLYTGGAGRIAIERVFESIHDKKNVWNDLRPDGMTDPLIFNQLAGEALDRQLTSDELEEMHTLYVEYFKEEIKEAPNFRVMPGIPELIPHLARQDSYLMGLQTGNFEAISWMKLGKAGLNEHFQFGGFGSDSPIRAELVRKAVERGNEIAQKEFDPSNIIVIGDAPQDIEAGKCLGVKTVSIATGKTEADALASLEPSLLLEDVSNPEELLRFIEAA